MPATFASGVRTAIDHCRNPRLGPEAYAAAIGFWAGNIMTLWAAFKAFGVEVPVGVLIQGFFVGMVANLAPSPAAGVGTVDAGPDRRVRACSAWPPRPSSRRCWCSG